MDLLLIQIPYTPRLSLCIGKPIAPPTNWDGKERGEPCPAELVDKLHSEILAEIRRVFDTYKAEAGYPDGVLEVE